MPVAIRVLLIDPDAAHREALEALLRAMGDFQPAGHGDVASAVTADPPLSHYAAALIAGEAATTSTEAMLSRGGFGGALILLGPLPDAAGRLTRPVETIERPVRIHDLAATLRTALRAHDRSEDARFGLGALTFDPVERQLSRPGGEPVRLTDKEVAILRYLHRAGSRPVGRDELLGEVWGYNSGVTTHTLETHIYRLRQKIEPVPGEARLLLTEEGGYRLALTPNQSVN